MVVILYFFRFDLAIVIRLMDLCIKFWNTGPCLAIFFVRFFAQHFEQSVNTQYYGAGIS